MRKPITMAILAALVSTGGILAPSADGLATAPNGAAAKKAIAGKGVFAPNQPGSQLLEDYGSFGLYRVDGAALSGAKASSVPLQVDNDADVLQFSAHPFDTQRDTLRAPAPFSMDVPSGPSLQIVQFIGPVKQAWLDALSARDIRPVQYVANSGYVVWADAAAQARLVALRSSASWLQYSAPLYGFLKVDPRLGDRLAAGASPDAEVDITVQVYAHPGVDATKRFVVGKGLVPTAQQAPIGKGLVTYAWTPILKFENLSLRVRVSDIPSIAERADVTFVGEKLPHRMMDEKQDIIMAGDFTPGPASIDYLQFLIDRGFSQTQADYPIVDLTDSTIDEGGTGVTVLATADPMLHVQGDLAQPVRVSYFKNCSTTPSSSVGAIDGHGSLNAGIIVGYDQRSGTPYQDPDGHQLGLGINPFGRVGSTAIFVPGYDVGGCGGSDVGVIQANWSTGARISSNSWGLTSPPSTYDDGDQAYDVGVRDADASISGNQEMIYLFAAANSGPGAATVSSPGAGKNVITVGASENVRPTWSDGCGVAPSGADNANDVINFSGRGPAPGQRTKPEVIGPGTHIQSGASIYSGYTGSGVCDQYHPTGQTVFAASSGTSHSTPATAGIASLAYWWIEQGGAGSAAGLVDEIGGSRAPSPALMKAWLIAHPTYLTGVGANDNLPSNAQGYGMPNMSDMFDDTPKVVLDQSEVFDNSGETRSYTWGIADPSKPVRIAMTYTDAPGALGTSPQVNNLDLKVDVAGQTYLGNHFDHQYSITGGTPDTKNNYEAVFLPAGTTGDVTITVTAINIAGDGVPNAGDGTDQDFALVCSNCSQAPSFTVSASDTSAQMCSGDDFSATVSVGSIQGYVDPVTLSLSGSPPGATSSVAPTTVTPVGTATLSVTDSASVAAGDYTVVLTATSGSIIKSLDFDLAYSSAAPQTPALDEPADGALNVTQTPVLTWEASDQASTYLVEVSRDPGFATIDASAEVSDTAWTVPTALDSNTRYYWRVTARNACGDSIATGGGDRVFGDGFDGIALPPLVSSFSFTTVALPGDCSIGSTQQVIWSDDLESGVGSWTHSGTGDTWMLGTTAAHGGTHAWQAKNASAVTDQRLVSPSVVLPGALNGLTLAFWSRQSLESQSGSGCFDGAIIEVTSNGGTTWTQITSGLLTDPYDGIVSGQYGNPLAGDQAWCGNPQAYLNSVIDLAPYAGQTVSFRFRMANDSSVGQPDPGWAIDDLKVAGCAQD